MNQQAFDIMQDVQRKQEEKARQDTVEHDGKIYKRTKRGYFHCPYGCGDPRYPRRKWKTVKGFVSHLQRCDHRPEAREKRKQERETRERQKAAALQEHIQHLRQTVDAHKQDVVYYSYEIIVKPTHDKRGRRMRYEPEKRFSVGAFKCADDVAVLLRYKVGASDIFATRDAAETDAKNKQRGWNAFVADSQRCR